MADSSEVYIGVDIGGTKVAAGLVNQQGEILHKTRTPMHARGTAEEALGCVRAAIDAIRAEHPDVRVGGIGLISPGPVDPQTGMVLNPSNLPCWHNYPLAEEVRKVYDLPTHVHNDANAAGLAEALWGAGAGYKCMFYATLGTGVGTAITYNAQLYLGRTGAAGEGGHMSIDYRGVRCRCGKSGCIETFAAGWAIAARAQEKLAREATRGKRIVELAGGKVENVNERDPGAGVGGRRSAGDRDAARDRRHSRGVVRQRGRSAGARHHRGRRRAERADGEVVRPHRVAVAVLVGECAVQRDSVCRGEVPGGLGDCGRGGAVRGAGAAVGKLSAISLLHSEKTNQSRIARISRVPLESSRSLVLLIE